MNKAYLYLFTSLNFYLFQVATIAQYAPVSTIANVLTYSNSATVTITATNFNNITGCDLRIAYDPSIALATSVAANPVIGGILNSNVSQPGLILISWFTASGTNVPDNTVIFNLGFSKVISGVCPINWNDLGPTCNWSSPGYTSLIDVPTANYYINGSVTFQSIEAPHTIAPVVSVCSGSVVDIPVRVTQFSVIGQVTLSLQYNPSILSLQSYTNSSGFPNLTIGTGTPGVFTISGTVPVGNPGISLPDSSVLATLHCFYSGGSLSLNWLDGGTACQYTGPPPAYTVLNDLPQNLFYINGDLSSLPLPGAAGVINGPAGGEVCPGQEELIFSVAPISNTTTYSWSFPSGYTITGGSGSNSITVSVGAVAESGEVTVYGINACGNGLPSPGFSVFVLSPPAILSQPVSPGAVMAGTGSAVFTVVAEGSYLEYQWQEFVNEWKNIIDTGVYSGALSDALTINQPPLSMNGHHYRCIIDGFCQPGVSTDGNSSLVVTPMIGYEEPLPGNIDISVHPNPVTTDSKITVKALAGSEISLIVRDIFGKISFSARGFVTGDGFFKIDFQPLTSTPGIYFLDGSILVGGDRYRKEIKLIFTE